MRLGLWTECGDLDGDAYAAPQLVLPRGCAARSHTRRRVLIDEVHETTAVRTGLNRKTVSEKVNTQRQSLSSSNHSPLADRLTDTTGPAILVLPIVSTLDASWQPALQHSPGGLHLVLCRRKLL